MNFSAVLFDMDGVLIDSEPGYNEAGKAFFRDLGLPFGPREIAAITGSTAPVIADQLFRWKPDLPYTRQQLIRRYEACIFAALKDGNHELIPGVSDWIRRLKALGAKLAIGSSSSYEMVMYVVERFGLSHQMDAIVTSRDAARGKPFPDIFLECCARLGVEPRHALVIEDSHNGVLAAAAAGCPCAAFLGTNRCGMDVSAANLSFPAFTPEHFQRLFGETL